MEGIVSLIVLLSGVLLAVAIFLAVVLLALINHKAERTNDLLEYLIQIQPYVGASATLAQPACETVSPRSK